MSHSVTSDGTGEDIERVSHVPIIEMVLRGTRSRNWDLTSSQDDDDDVL